MTMTFKAAELASQCLAIAGVYDCTGRKLSKKRFTRTTQTTTGGNKTNRAHTDFRVRPPQHSQSTVAYAGDLGFLVPIHSVSMADRNGPRRCQCWVLQIRRRLSRLTTTTT